MIPNSIKRWPEKAVQQIGAALVTLSVFSPLWAAASAQDAQQAEQAITAREAAEIERAVAAEAAQASRVAAEQATEQAIQQSERAREEAELERAVAADFAARQAEQEAQIAEAQRQVAEASRAMAEAARALEEERAGQQADLEKSRAELSRAHEALREASREVARAHRDLERDRRVTEVRRINLGDRAVIGVLLGESGDQGLELAGVTPGGPAEEAGLQKGDILVSLDDSSLVGHQENGARDMLLARMNDVQPGEEINVEYLRDGQREAAVITAERREPRSWQSMIRLPSPPSPPSAPGQVPPVDAPHVVVERIRVPGSDADVMVIDDEALAVRLAELEGRMQGFQYMFIDEDGTTIEFDEKFDFNTEDFSRIGEDALHQANMWFGLSHTEGLELASLNPELGSYFKADSGVLVLRAEADNPYGLESGDVIREVAGKAVASPAELIRALREFEPGAEIKLGIKRDRKDKTLTANLPDGRLGAHFNWDFAPEQAPHSGHP